MRKFSLAIFIFASMICCGFKTKDNCFDQKMINGLPEAMKLNWPDAFYAPINGGEFYKQIYIVFKSKTDFPSRANIVLHKNEGGLSMSPIGFENCHENKYKAQTILKTELEDELIPLNIQIDAEDNSISYNWGETTSQKMPKILKEYPLKIGKVFPPLSIEMEIGSKSIRAFKGKIVVINWWATTCIPCIEEMPGLNKLVKKYENENLIFLSILWDKNNLKRFREKYIFDYTQGFSNDEIFNTLGGTFPRNIILDKNGIILYNKLGGSKDTNNELDQVIQKLLQI